MNDKYLAAKIWSEYLKFGQVRVRQNLTWQEILDCESYRESQYALYRFEPFLSEKEAREELGISDSTEDTLTRLSKTVDNTKMSIYQYVVNGKDVTDLKKELEKTQVSISKIENLLVKVDSYTLNGFLNELEEVHSIKLRTEGDYSSIYDVRQKLYEGYPKLEDIRSVAKGQWYQSQKDFFKPPYFDGPRNFFQISLMSWADIYHNISQLEDVPPQSVVDDDDAFDGWMIARRINSGSSTNSKKPSKHAGAQEQFKFVNSQEEADAVALSNTPQARAAQQARMQTLMTKGVFDLHKKDEP